MTDVIKIKVVGLDALIAKFGRLPEGIEKYLHAAGEEAAREVLETEGLKKYPPATAANAPGRTKTVVFGGGKTATFRMPYYIRGRGTMQPVRGGGWKQLATSEKYGTQWAVSNEAYRTVIGNRASYAPYLAGSRQARAMARIGWRKLADVAREKLKRITKIYAAWVRQAIKDLEL